MHPGGAGEPRPRGGGGGGAARVPPRGAPPGSCRRRPRRPSGGSAWPSRSRACAWPSAPFPPQLDAAGATRELFRALGLPPPAPKRADLVKLTPEGLSDLVVNFDEVAAPSSRPGRASLFAAQLHREAELFGRVRAARPARGPGA